MKQLLKTASDKLRSTRGASLSMALLLFLICAILGGTILTAGTVTAGRIAKKAEMDARYYNVTSAAELLADEFSGRPVTITRTRTRTETIATPYTITDTTPGREKVDQGTPVTTTTVTYATDVNGNGSPVTSGTSFSVDGQNRSFLTARAAARLFGKDSEGNAECNTDAAFDRSFSQNTNTESGTFTLTHFTTDLNEAPDSLGGTYEVLANGSIVLTLESGGYAVRVALNPTADESLETVTTGNETPEVTHTDATHYTETIRSTVTETKISTITWKCESIR